METLQAIIKLRHIMGKPHQMMIRQQYTMTKRWNIKTKRIKIPKKCVVAFRMYWPNFFTYLRIVTFWIRTRKGLVSAAMLSAGNDRKKNKKRAKSPNAQTRLSRQLTYNSRLATKHVNANVIGYSGRVELSFEQSLHPIAHVIYRFNQA